GAARAERVAALALLLLPFLRRLQTHLLLALLLLAAQLRVALALLRFPPRGTLVQHVLLLRVALALAQLARRVDVVDHQQRAEAAARCQCEPTHDSAHRRGLKQGFIRRPPPAAGDLLDGVSEPRCCSRIETLRA